MRYYGREGAGLAASTTYLKLLAVMSTTEATKPQVKQEGDRGSAQSTDNSKAADGALQNKPAGTSSASSNTGSNVKDTKVDYVMKFLMQRISCCCIFVYLLFYVLVIR